VLTHVESTCGLGARAWGKTFLTGQLDKAGVNLAWIRPKSHPQAGEKTLAKSHDLAVETLGRLDTQEGKTCASSFVGGVAPGAKRRNDHLCGQPRGKHRHTWNIKRGVTHGKKQKNK